MATEFWAFLIFPCAMIRFAIFAPIGYYWAVANDHFHIVSKHVELQNGTYGTAVLAGETIAAKWGTIAFYWNFAVWIPLFALQPPLNLPFVIVDIFITIYLSKATHYQTGYSPHNKSICHNSNFYIMQRPPGANESFFEAAARSNSTTSTPTDMCVSFVKEWQYGIALSFFYALVSLLNILAFFASLNAAKNQGKTLRDMLKGVGLGAFKCLVDIPKAIMVILVAFFYSLPVVLFRCLPLKVKASLRSKRRSAVKAALGAEQATVIMMTELITDINRKRDAVGRYQGVDGKYFPLAQFLGTYDMLMAVTEQLHYVEIINLSRVSKSVREAVLPTHDISRRLNVFKHYTCEPSTKTQCWKCTNQICTDCQQISLIPQTIILHHMDNCQPYCKDCYKTHVACSPPNRRLSYPYCKCAPIPARPRNFLWRWTNRSAYYFNQNSLPTQGRPICRECNKMSRAELLALREKMTKADLRQGLQISGEKWVKCAMRGCGKDLGTGPRWWVCNTAVCRKECSSPMHGAWVWGQKNGEGKDGVVMGEEAV
ncbi:hypothetical protein EJ02DRAFT_121088 [Clathrospora elynae]|uniref:Uncharacterized protein n=1 Tax=Clathrospora elynae TaxID=706981 RepID=A0A6A5SV24_9PLEO|nr:hypothetical protein EJ02DRAFT_121088 [Clathrospora elynae]